MGTRLKPRMDYKNTLIVFIESLCLDLGINTRCDYDGVENDMDIVVYKDEIIKEVRKLKEGR